MTPMMIRLDVEQMRYGVVHAFNQHSREMEEAISTELKSVLDGFNFAAVVQEQARVVLTDAVKSAVARAVADIMYAPEISEYLAKAARAHVQRAITEAFKVDVYL